MKFQKFIPAAPLRPYIHHLVVSENDLEGRYKVLPSPGIVMGFQYKGQLSIVQSDSPSKLTSTGITGIGDRFRVFENSANIGTVLVYFTETGLAHFSRVPADELFNSSLSLEHIFSRDSLLEVEEKLSLVNTDKQRVKAVERFLISQMREVQTDKLIIEAVRLIYQSGGTLRMKELSEKLFISQSPFEKRFKRVVGATPKKFASIIRFNSVLNELPNNKSLIEICYEYNFFDQAHFIRAFKQFTGDTPENFRRFM